MLFDRNLRLKETAQDRSTESAATVDRRAPENQPSFIAEISGATRQTLITTGLITCNDPTRPRVWQRLELEARGTGGDFKLLFPRSLGVGGHQLEARQDRLGNPVGPRFCYRAPDKTSYRDLVQGRLVLSAVPDQPGDPLIGQLRATTADQHGRRVHISAKFRVTSGLLDR